MRVDATRNGDEITLPQGEFVEVGLEERPTSGFRWNVLSDGQPVCRLAGDAFEPASGPLGASGLRTWRFETLEPGLGVIEIVHRRAWEEAASTQTFTLRVRVSPAG